LKLPQISFPKIWILDNLDSHFGGKKRNIQDISEDPITHRIVIKHKIKKIKKITRNFPTYKEKI